MWSPLEGQEYIQSIRLTSKYQDMTQEWVIVYQRAVDKSSLPRTYWLKWSRRRRPIKQEVPTFSAPPLTPSLHPETAPRLALWVGVCFRILPNGEYLITRVLFFKLNAEWGLCFWDGYFWLSLIFWFLSFCQDNSNEVTCLLLWCGSCHLAG